MEAIQGLGFRFQGLGFRFQGSAFRIKEKEEVRNIRAPLLGCRDEDYGFILISLFLCPEGSSFQAGKTDEILAPFKVSRFLCTPGSAELLLNSVCCFCVPQSAVL